MDEDRGTPGDSSDDVIGSDSLIPGLEEEVGRRYADGEDVGGDSAGVGPVVDDGSGAETAHADRAAGNEPAGG